MYGTATCRPRPRETCIESSSRTTPSIRKQHAGCALRPMEDDMRQSNSSPAVLALAALFSVTALAQDKSTYYTVMHPKEFAIDWAGFYTKAEQMTAAARKA